MSAARGQEAASTQGKTLTIATYNLKNMFDVFDDPYTSDETTRVKPREDIEAIAICFINSYPIKLSTIPIEVVGRLELVIKESLMP